MRKGLLVANGLILAGITWLFGFGTEQNASMLLPRDALVASRFQAAEIPDLEHRAALEADAKAVADLATAYLDRDQPGLATAVIERAPRDIESRPDVALLHARALFARGRAREALALARDASSACEAEATAACAPWLLAKSTRQVAFFEEVVAAGIDDPASDPAATRAAYERSSREVRLVAMR